MTTLERRFEQALKRLRETGRPQTALAFQSRHGGLVQIHNQPAACAVIREACAAAGIKDR